MQKKQFATLFLCCSVATLGFASEEVTEEGVNAGNMLYADPLRVSLFGEAEFNATMKNNEETFKVGVYNRPIQFDVGGKIGMSFDAPIGNFMTMGATVEVKKHDTKLDSMDEKYFYANDDGQFVEIWKAVGSTADADKRKKFKATKDSSADTLVITMEDGTDATNVKNISFLEYKDDAFVKLPTNSFSSLYFNKMYFHLTAPMLSAKAGRFDTPEKELSLGVHNIALATGGVNGKWKDYVNQGPDPTAAYADETKMNPKFLKFRTSSDLYLESLNAKPPAFAIGGEVAGMKLGVAYIPDTGNLSHLSGKMLSGPNDGGDYKNVFSFGAQYRHPMNEGYIALGAVGETGDPEQVCKIISNKLECVENHQKLFSWGFGAEVKYYKFSIAASYGNLGKSGQLRNIGALTDADYVKTATELQKRGMKPDPDTHLDKEVPAPDDYETSFINAGVRYDSGPWSAGFTYLKGYEGQMDKSGGKTETTLYSIGAEYFLYKGASIYAEGTHFTLDDKTYATCKDNSSQKIAGAYYAKAALPKINKGTVLLVGCKLKV